MDEEPAERAQPRGLVEWVGHACTPWDWRYRGEVVALVVVMAGLFAASVLAGIAEGHSWQSRLVRAVVNGVIAFLLFLRPAVRSLRRWDAARAQPDGSV